MSDNNRDNSSLGVPIEHELWNHTSRGDVINILDTNMYGEAFLGSYEKHERLESPSEEASEKIAGIEDRNTPDPRGE